MNKILKTYKLVHHHPQLNIFNINRKISRNILVCYRYLFCEDNRYKSQSMGGVRGSEGQGDKVGEKKVGDFGVRTRKRHSEWIFSTRHEEQLYRKPGSISIYTHFNQDTHNASLRLVQNIEKAHLILTNSPQNIHTYLQSIKKKQQFCQPTPTSTTPIESPIPTSLSDLLHPLSTPQTLQYNTQIQISKMIELQKQIKKEEGETNNSMLEKQARQLKKYMDLKVFEDRLKDIKDRQGYPAVFDIMEEIKRGEGEGNGEENGKNESGRSDVGGLVDNMNRIVELKEKGFNIVIGFWEGHDKSGQIGYVIRQLQQKKIGYEILPCTDEMITAIVSSGFPADRFCLQLFPTQNLQELIKRRSKVKLTTCFHIHKKTLPTLIKSLTSTLSTTHHIYLHSTSHPFRGQLHNITQHLQCHPITTQTVHLIVSPYIAQFNEKLTEQLNIESHLKNQLMSEHLNIVQLEILNKKMDERKKRQEMFEVDAVEMVAEMIVRIKDENIVRQCLKSLWPKKTQAWREKVLKQGKSRIGQDYLGLSNYSKGKWNQLKQQQQQKAK